MVSERSALIVRTTLPAVGASFGSITELFYRRMFEEQPELLGDLFNRANQASGTQREALAGAVAVFATALVEHPTSAPRPCWSASRASTPRSASPRTSTRWSPVTSSGPW